MALTVEMINQSVFTAALFLLLVSVPKLVFLTINYGYRTWVYRNSKVLTEKYVGRIISQPNIAKGLKEWADDPTKVVVQQLKEYSNFSKDVRDPIIEAIIGLAIMVWFYPVFSEISTWLIAALVTILIFVVSAIVLFLLTRSIKDINKIPINDQPAASKPKETP